MYKYIYLNSLNITVKFEEENNNYFFLPGNVNQTPLAYKAFFGWVPVPFHLQNDIKERLNWLKKMDML